MIVDIGGGKIPKGVNLDPTHGEGEWKRLAQNVPWPCGDGEADQIVSRHVLEHIPAGADRVAVFNEAHRVLKRGGRFEIVVPLVGHDDELVDHWAAWADPTHVSYWWFPQSLWYFTGKLVASADYGIRKWRLLGWQVNGGCEGKATLVKP